LWAYEFGPCRLGAPRRASRLLACLRGVAHEAETRGASSLYRTMQRDFAYRMYCFTKD
jgi:hypothetical protein